VPLEIMNRALYADRTVQDWHRSVMPRTADAIDLDLMGACRFSYCRDPLYLLESTTRDDKPVTILRRLAEKADTFGIVVVHDTETIRGFRVIYDPTRGKVPEIARETHSEGLASLLLWIREFHNLDTHSVA